MNIEYTIKPRLYLIERDLWLFSDEIHQMDFAMIQDGIDSCQLAMNEKYEVLNWGLEVSELEIRKDISVLTYNSKFVAEFQTIELCNMLKNYRDALIMFNRDKK
jgi:hypothetical protein